MLLAVTKADILAFQDDIKERFLRGEIRHPVHLCDPSQLDHLLPIFEDIQPQDWLFTSYRGMFHWLLKGIPPERLLKFIVEHGAMGFCDKEYRIVSSAIVGGCLPIALGVAMGLKWQGKTERVWAFLGDMTAETGGFYEATKYAGRHDLPVKWVIEDNGLSTNTPTQGVWGPERLSQSNRVNPWMIGNDYGTSVLWYKYERLVAHVGVGQWVTFS